MKNAALFLLIVLPVLAVAVISHLRIDRVMTEAALARRESVASLVAIALKEKMDNLSSVGVSLATRVRFRLLIQEGKWTEAIQIMKSVPADIPIIERVFVTDPAGTLMADTPEVPEVRGRSLASRDWHRGVSAAWRPYVSEMYGREAAPPYTVVAVAVPIRSDDQKVIGILALQIRVAGLLEWGRSVRLGPEGFVCFVDRRGHVAGHPRFPSDVAVADLSGYAPVRESLQGKRGVEVLRDPLESDEVVVAYEPVPVHGWGVVAQQPARAAFATRDGSLRFNLGVYGVIFLCSCALAYFIIHTLVRRRRAEQEIRRLYGQLEAAFKELESFSYAVSHDLRAPLRSIAGFGQALVEDCGDRLSEGGREHVGRMQAAATRMGQLIDDLLNLARIARAQMRREAVDLSAVARGVLADLRQAEPARKVECALADGVVVQGDPALLRVVMENLLGNAWKFTAKREAAKIEFGMTVDGGEKAYFVRDNGAGFDMAYVGKLFGAFQRLHGAQEFAGTGIGLATVQRIVQRHGGRVWAQGAVDQGATVYFTLG